MSSRCKERPSETAKKEVAMCDPEKAFEESVPSPGSSIHPSLLRRLADHYCRIYLVRVLEGYIHNLNNPLQILTVRSEQFERDAGKLIESLESGTTAEAKKLAERIESRVGSFMKSLAELNAGLGFLTKSVLLQRRSEIGRVNINEVIKDTLFLLNANMFFKHKVKKTLKLADDLPEVRGRHTDICIVILNLVQNAIEAMAQVKERHLTIETRREKANVVINIQDSGCGIPRENRQDIYEPFFSTKRGIEYEGKLDEHAGIGLSLVSFLLDDLDGHIVCESIPGKTVFSVVLPCEVE